MYQLQWNSNAIILVANNLLPCGSNITNPKKTYENIFIKKLKIYKQKQKFQLFD
jgi:hypothetical protein